MFSDICGTTLGMLCMLVVWADSSELTYDRAGNKAYPSIGKNRAASPWATASSSPHRQVT